MVGFMRRFDPAYAEAKRRIEAGELGKVFAIRCVSEDPVDPDGFFVRFAPTSGGIFLDCCIHDIDLVRWMLDGAETASVAAAGSRLMYPALGACGDVDTGSANVAFEGGQMATFYVSRTSHRGYEASMTIVGDKGALEIGAAIPQAAADAGARRRPRRPPAKPTSSNASAKPSGYEAQAFIKADSNRRADADQSRRRPRGDAAGLRHARRAQDGLTAAERAAARRPRPRGGAMRRATGRARATEARADSLTPAAAWRRERRPSVHDRLR